MNDASRKLANLSPEAKRALLAQLLREKARGNELKEWSPISHNQKALWFLQRLAPTSAAYNLLYAARMQAQLDRPALERAVQTLVRRYPILTATYAMQDTVPTQRLHLQHTIEIENVDATTWTLDCLTARLYEESNRPIDLEQGPVMRIALFQRANDDYVLALIVHHIAADFWALDILVDELYLLYAAEKTGLPSSLPAVGPQNEEYVLWQQKMLASDEGEQHWSYWRETLAGELPVLSLPTDRPRPPVQTYRGASHRFALGEQITRQLKALAAREKVTLFTLMLTAFQSLLFRYTNQEDIIVGTPALGRGRPDLERVVGYLANPVLVRASLADNPTFLDLLRQTRQGVIDALEHQDFPFPLLVERLQPKRDPSYSPIYQTLFIWDRPRTRSQQDLASLGQNELARRIAEDGLALEPFAYGQQGAPFDLTLTIFEIEGTLSGDIRYNIDLFDASTIARMEQHFQCLLRGIVEQPEQHLLALPLLTSEEYTQHIVTWNATQRAYPDQASLHQLIEEQVERSPDEIALIFGEQRRTYDQLNREANQLAHRLQAAGVQPDTLVGVCMERSIEMVVALLAVLKAGGAYVPLDPTYPPERLAYMLRDAHVAILLTQTHIQEGLPLEHVQTVFRVDPGWNTAVTGCDENPVSGARPDNLVYMIYTSGSTGKPKGVMNTHQGLCNRLFWMQQTYQLTVADRVLQKTPFSFDVSVWEFFWPLLSGAALVIARPGGHQDPAYLAQLIAEHQVTTLHFVPSMLQAFLQERGLERCASLRRVICSGEALTLELQTQFFARFPAPTQLHNLYGPTEAAIDVTAWQCQRGSNEWSVPIGYPIANTQIYIVNAALQPVPIGVPGELLIGGVGLARGYHNLPKLTAERFIHNPFSQDDNARLFKTGDLARYRADGAIEFLGRIDYQVKLRGFRIELGEIEAVLSQHPDLKEVVVVAHTDASGNKRLVAYLVAAPQVTPPSIETLRAFLKEKLPDYMVPAVFMYLNDLPLAPNGKVDRKALPAPDSARPELETTFVAPRTATEKQLASIWSEVLNIDSIGIHDNYFDLGGASIQSLEILSKVTAAGLPLALEMLFEHQTIAELAQALDSRQAAPAQSTATEVSQAPVIASVAVNANEQSKTDLGNTIIESLGVYLPPKIVSSKEIIDNCSRPIRFPLARLTGIQNRRIAGETEFSLDLAKKAVADCLANSKYNPEDIDLLVCGNISRCNTPGLEFAFEPNTAVQLQQHFGFNNAIVLDVSNACTGMFTAAYIVDAFIKAGLARRGMVVSGEYISHLIRTAQKEIENYMDSRLACLTVGDAGAALILERSPDKKLGFHEFEMYTLGRYSEACIGKMTKQEHGGGIMYTDAVLVSAVNLKHAVAHAGYVIDRSQWPRNSFQHIVVHQTSKTTINDVPREINKHFGEEVCAPDSVINNIAERGNTATTTHMVAIMDSIRSNRIQSGDNAVFGITGSGATIGTALYTFDDLPDRIRRREAGEYTPEKIVSDKQPYISKLSSTRRIQIANVGTVPLDAPGEKKTLALIQTAAEKCLADSSYDRQAIDLLMYSGVYRDEFLCEPAIAALVAGAMDINGDIETEQDKKSFALDVFNSGLGTLNACYIAIGLIQAQKAQNALIVASEIENNRDKQPADLVGIEETGSALLLDESPNGTTGFGNFVFESFTDYMEARGSHTATRNGKSYLDLVQDPHLESYYVRCIQQAVQELLDLEQLSLEQITVVLPPQISSSFIAELSNKLEVSRDKMVDVHSQHDLFTSSLAYGLQHVRDHHLVKPGDIGLIINVGAGLQVGCATYYF